MKIFISSLITGMEAIRSAVREGIEILGYDAIMAEDFVAQPNSPQVACLQGLRNSALVILILGDSYGAKQANGLSATHQEYREAKDKYPVIAFVQNIEIKDHEQAEFIKEVQGWEKGLFRGDFTTSDQLKNNVIRAIHSWDLSTAVAPLDSDSLNVVAVSAVLDAINTHNNSSQLILSVIAGPIQPILRPSEIEKSQLAEDLLQAALFGEKKIFETNIGSSNKIEKDSLVLYQNEIRSIKLDPQGGLLFGFNVLDQSRDGFGSGSVMITENVENQIKRCLFYAAWVLDKIDPTHRLTHVSMAIGFTGHSHLIMRTKAEQDASPTSYTYRHSNSTTNKPIQLTPPHRLRAALSNDTNTLTEDFITLIKRSLN